MSFYQNAHRRVYRLWGSASQYPCVRCGGSAKDWAYDGMDPSSSINCSQNPEFYMPLCRRCHSYFDCHWHTIVRRPALPKPEKPPVVIPKNPRTEEEWNLYLTNRWS